MEDNRSTLSLNEPLTPQVGGMIKGGIAVIGAYILVAIIAMARRENDPETLWLLAGITVFSIGGLLFLWWLCSRERLIVDEAGIRTRSLLGKIRALEWPGIRTAAVVRLSANEMHHWIVLSTDPDPARVLTRKRQTRKAKAGEELRIPYGEKRREAVEHYLNMTLPEIRL